ncbi:hypothetical protein J3E72DRAFT_3182 [Bipolaris maydis]|uniref:uncharacterized protein n=1 Tax=Cochliobolus heterostrophus TaxID=5016 RepID=UPI0024CE9D94|nr:hypothetical protein J3E73DRAFT_18971 [Bipolaris maydis]KAJ5055015.1 hypothetical protein J3E74DRAFT_19482 [Bipolaris maydis]KAJ6202890.1 hypothetical protein J3E72DRAFT_3182 [Bipolaris maydis]KAJ6275424.1 hypothetical protein PSV08DRAFT_455 [Bipolaris maydis]KAJ6286613.1 hypothetical protein J3E71DRAFT_477 [Bipolaris maydis]
MATTLPGQAQSARQLYSYVLQPQLYSDHHHPDRQNTPEGPISIAFSKSSRRTVHTNNDLIKGVVHVKARLQIKRVTIKFIGKTTCRISNDRNPANPHCAEVELFCHEKTLSRIQTPTATCPPSRIEYPFEFRFPEKVEGTPKLQNEAPFKPDALFEHETGHQLPPSLWCNENSICNEYFLRAEYVAEQTSFTLNPVVVHQLRFSPSVPELNIPSPLPLLPAPPIRFERKSRPSTPDPSKERRASLKRLASGLRNSSTEKLNDTSVTSLLILRAPAQYRVGAPSTLKISLQATLTNSSIDQQQPPAAVHLRGIRAQVSAHITSRVPLASTATGDIRSETIEKFDLFNHRYVKPGIEITHDTTLDGLLVSIIVPPTFKTYAVALRYDVKYNLLLECAGKESEHEVEMKDVVIEPMTRPGGHLGPPEEPPPPLREGEMDVAREMMMMSQGGANGVVWEQVPPPAYQR